MASLEAELLRMLEEHNTLLESADYELYQLSLLDPKVVQETAKQHAVAVEVEIKQLTKKALQLEQEIVELTGKSSGVN